MKAGQRRLWAYQAGRDHGDPVIWDRVGFVPSSSRL